MHINAGRMARGPRSVRDLVPMASVSRIPHIFAVASVTVVSFQDPQSIVKDGHVVILTRMPRGGRCVLFPCDAVG